MIRSNKESTLIKGLSSASREDFYSDPIDWMPAKEPQEASPGVATASAGMPKFTRLEDVIACPLRKANVPRHGLL